MKKPWRYSWGDVFDVSLLGVWGTAATVIIKVLLII
jgi:hypothetical protein